ncbi:hypothetical protein CXG81DRAFT_19377 [Caulochytrium protostelioides]|uniref:Uncharacterized protein n=1 Tax=Caulochytrium protostelioides TaxID=1555241 RepID=A0A4P9X6U4_9FUNG|nr:hypothetical protein CXG81DRAFT_19377 [Caulochytrium protostelioides]|eukprot:RKP00721.1 hypothetical protein CXG81DRAFT_19377 [Caulochytrium protostelioides]
MAQTLSSPWMAALCASELKRAQTHVRPDAAFPDALLRAVQPEPRRALPGVPPPPSVAASAATVPPVPSITQAAQFASYNKIRRVQVISAKPNPRKRGYLERNQPYLLATCDISDSAVVVKAHFFEAPLKARNKAKKKKKRQQAAAAAAASGAALAAPAGGVDGPSASATAATLDGLSHHDDPADWVGRVLSLQRYEWCIKEDKNGRYWMSMNVYAFDVLARTAVVGTPTPIAQHDEAPHAGLAALKAAYTAMVARHRAAAPEALDLVYPPAMHPGWGAFPTSLPDRVLVLPDALRTLLDTWESPVTDAPDPAMLGARPPIADGADDADDVGDADDANNAVEAGEADAIAKADKARPTSKAAGGDEAGRGDVGIPPEAGAHTDEPDQALPAAAAAVFPTTTGPPHGDVITVGHATATVAGAPGERRLQETADAPPLRAQEEMQPPSQTPSTLPSSVKRGLEALPSAPASSAPCEEGLLLADPDSGSGSGSAAASEAEAEAGPVADPEAEAGSEAEPDVVHVADPSTEHVADHVMDDAAAHADAAPAILAEATTADMAMASEDETARESPEAPSSEAERADAELEAETQAEAEPQPLARLQPESEQEPELEPAVDAMANAGRLRILLRVLPGGTPRTQLPRVPIEAPAAATAEEVTPSSDVDETLAFAPSPPGGDSDSPMADATAPLPSPPPQGDAATAAAAAPTALAPALSRTAPLAGRKGLAEAMLPDLPLTHRLTHSSDAVRSDPPTRDGVAASDVSRLTWNPAVSSAAPESAETVASRVAPLSEQMPTSSSAASAAMASTSADGTDGAMVAEPPLMVTEAASAADAGDNDDDNDDRGSNDAERGSPINATLPEADYIGAMPPAADAMTLSPDLFQVASPSPSPSPSSLPSSLLPRALPPAASQELVLDTELPDAASDSEPEHELETDPVSGHATPHVNDDGVASAADSSAAEASVADVPADASGDDADMADMAEMTELTERADMAPPPRDPVSPPPESAWSTVLPPSLSPARSPSTPVVDTTFHADATTIAIDTAALETGDDTAPIEPRRHVVFRYAVSDSSADRDGNGTPSPAIRTHRHHDGAPARASRPESASDAESASRSDSASDSEEESGSEEESDSDKGSESESESESKSEEGEEEAAAAAADELSAEAEDPSMRDSASDRDEPFDATPSQVPSDRTSSGPATAEPLGQAPHMTQHATRTTAALAMSSLKLLEQGMAMLEGDDPAAPPTPDISTPLTPTPVTQAESPTETPTEMSAESPADLDSMSTMLAQTTSIDEAPASPSSSSIASSSSSSPSTSSSSSPPPSSSLMTSAASPSSEASTTVPSSSPSPPASQSPCHAVTSPSPAPVAPTALPAFPAPRAPLSSGSLALPSTADTLPPLSQYVALELAANDDEDGGADANAASDGNADADATVDADDYTVDDAEADADAEADGDAAVDDPANDVSLPDVVVNMDTDKDIVRATPVQTGPAFSATAVSDSAVSASAVTGTADTVATAATAVDEFAESTDHTDAEGPLSANERGMNWDTDNDADDESIDDTYARQSTVLTAAPAPLAAASSTLRDARTAHAARPLAFVVATSSASSASDSDFASDHRRAASARATPATAARRPPLAAIRESLPSAEMATDPRLSVASLAPAASLAPSRCVEANVDDGDANTATDVNIMDVTTATAATPHAAGMIDTTAAAETPLAANANPAALPLFLTAAHAEAALTEAASVPLPAFLVDWHQSRARAIELVLGSATPSPPPPPTAAAIERGASERPALSHPYATPQADHDHATPRGIPDALLEVEASAADTLTHPDTPPRASAVVGHAAAAPDAAHAPMGHTGAVGDEIMILDTEDEMEAAAASLADSPVRENATTTIDQPAETDSDAHDIADAHTDSDAHTGPDARALADANPGSDAETHPMASATASPAASAIARSVAPAWTDALSESDIATDGDVDSEAEFTQALGLTPSSPPVVMATMSSAPHEPVTAPEAHLETASTAFETYVRVGPHDQDHSALSATSPAAVTSISASAGDSLDPASHHADTLDRALLGPAALDAGRALSHPAETESDLIFLAETDDLPLSPIDAAAAAFSTNADHDDAAWTVYRFDAPPYTSTCPDHHDEDEPSSSPRWETQRPTTTTAASTTLVVADHHDGTLMDHPVGADMDGAVPSTDDRPPLPPGTDDLIGNHSTHVRGVSDGDDDGEPPMMLPTWSPRSRHGAVSVTTASETHSDTLPPADPTSDADSEADSEVAIHPQLMDAMRQHGAASEDTYVVFPPSGPWSDPLSSHVPDHGPGRGHEDDVLPSPAPADHATRAETDAETEQATSETDELTDDGPDRVAAFPRAAPVSHAAAATTDVPAGDADADHDEATRPFLTPPSTTERERDLDVDRPRPLHRDTHSPFDADAVSNAETGSDACATIATTTTDGMRDTPDPHRPLPISGHAAVTLMSPSVSMATAKTGFILIAAPSTVPPRDAQGQSGTRRSYPSEPHDHDPISPGQGRSQSQSQSQKKSQGQSQSLGQRLKSSPAFGSTRSKHPATAPHASGKDKGPRKGFASTVMPDLFQRWPGLPIQPLTAKPKKSRSKSAIPTSRGARPRGPSGGGPQAVGIGLSSRGDPERRRHDVVPIDVALVVLAHDGDDDAVAIHLASRA